MDSQKRVRFQISRESLIQGMEHFFEQISLNDIVRLFNEGRYMYRHFLLSVIKYDKQK